MRAREDPFYAELLSNVRWGRISDQQLARLNARVHQHPHETHPIRNHAFYRPVVVSTNKIRCAVNVEVTFSAAGRLHTPVYECKAIASKRSEHIVEKLANVNDDLTDRIPMKLLFYIGMPVMITKKHPELLGINVIANGVLGTLVGFAPQDSTDQYVVSKIGDVIVNKFIHQPQLLLVRIRSSTEQLMPGLPPGVIAIPPLHTTIRLQRIPNLAQTSATITQFPVVPAFACTTEKLQGQTCRDGVIVTRLERQRNTPRQTLYVALSRSVSLDKITLTEPITREYIRKFQPSKETIDEMRRLCELIRTPPYAPLDITRECRELHLVASSVDLLR